MTKKLQIYKCPVCGNMVEVIHEGAGELVCCGEPMNLLSENTTDAATEKHVPVLQRSEAGCKVTVGSVEHPMTEDHHIEWIELILDGKALRVFLKPGESPAALFEAADCASATAREYCNLHGLWKS